MRSIKELSINVEMDRAYPWQPIETAPRDGSAIILTDGDCVNEGSFVECVESGAFENKFVYTFSWDGLDGYLVQACDPQPTHWMPLPEPPTT